ncbi:MAG: hypothetical protein M1819_000939 [Sarea resinae]|nr:MAG: hypothetical protein M1819_000939 [Sarea resinae]
MDRTSSPTPVSAEQSSPSLSSLSSLSSPLSSPLSSEATASTASPSFLTTLPPELILAIFKEMASFTDVGSLMLTAPVLHNVWKSHAQTILDTLLPRLIFCFPEAQGLATAQEFSEFTESLGSKTFKPGEEPQQPHPTLEHRLHRILANDHAVTLAFESFEYYLSHDNPPDHASYPKKLTPTERARFTRSYYLLLSIFYHADVNNDVMRQTIRWTPISEHSLLRSLCKWRLQPLTTPPPQMYAGPGQTPPVGFSHGQRGKWKKTYFELERVWTERVRNHLGVTAGRLFDAENAPGGVWKVLDQWQQCRPVHRLECWGY